ncbi:MAG: SUMF1/EgtB/PvdO family nonheme iron enzyme [Byssovorax sp.]
MRLSLAGLAGLAGLAALALVAGCAAAERTPDAPRPAVEPPAPVVPAPPKVEAPRAIEVPASPLAAPAAAVIKPAAGPSCTGAPGAGNDCNGESCCARIDVPEGDFELKADGAPNGVSTHVKAFALDKYEATVGRVRAWIKAGRPVPAEGDVLYAAGDKTVRWPKDAPVQSEQAMTGWKRYDTWTGGEERRPKNFLSWYTAAAFCHAEGGRLPTDAEWKYVAAGGDENRPYPWGSEPPSPEMAVFNCTGNGDQSCSLDDILPVGSRPRGAGRWGHQDLAGSMFEWTLDGGTAEQPDTAEEVSRGGGFCYIGGVDRRAKTGLRPGVFRKESATTVSHMVGVRCAYDHRT